MILIAPTKSTTKLNLSNSLTKNIHFCYHFENRLGTDLVGKFNLTKYGNTAFRTNGVSSTNGCFSSSSLGFSKVWSVATQFNTGGPGMTFLNIFSITQYPLPNEGFILCQGSNASNNGTGTSGTMGIFYNGSNIYIRTALWDDTFGMRFNTQGTMPDLVLNKVYVAVGVIRNGNIQTYLYPLNSKISSGTVGTYSTINNFFSAQRVNVAGVYNTASLAVEANLKGSIYLSAGFLRALTLGEIYSLIKNPYQILTRI
jgi:hypothetical protein